jgi:hypothetical protein
MFCSWPNKAYIVDKQHYTVRSESRCALGA